MVSGLVEGRTGGLEYQRGVGCLDSGGFREGGLMCDSWLLEELVFGALSPPQAGKSSVLCVRLSFHGGCWRELRRSLSSLTPSPSPRPPKHGVLPPRTTATSVCRRIRDKRTSPRNCRGDKGSGDIPGGESGDGGDGLAGALEREEVSRPSGDPSIGSGGRPGN